jgi:hypothetical protein
MQSTHDLWSALERVPAQSNILAAWQRLLGSDFHIACSFFRPTDRRASRFPCPRHGGDGCPRRVVDYGGGEIIAVCNDEYEGCDDITLSPEDIISHELDRRKMVEVVAKALEIQPAFAPLEEFHRTSMVGEVNAGGSRRFPVILATPLDADSLLGIMTRLLFKLQVPFILLTYTKNMVSLEMKEMMDRNKSCFMALDEILVWNEQAGGLVGGVPADELLSGFIEKAAPELTKSNSMDHFPTPPGARWEHFIFEFLADSVLLVRCKGVHQTMRLEPEQLGMKNMKNGKSTKQWELLKIFALLGGSLSWGSQHADPQIKNRKQILSKKLKSFFHIDDEPIPWKRGVGAWETQFILRQYQSHNYEPDQKKQTIFEEALYS